MDFLDPQTNRFFLEKDKEDAVFELKEIKLSELFKFYRRGDKNDTTRVFMFFYSGKIKVCQHHSYTFS